MELEEAEAGRIRRQERAVAQPEPPGGLRIKRKYTKRHQKWFKSAECPLDNTAAPGIRGWLARVIDEGEACVGEAVRPVP